MRFLVEEWWTVLTRSATNWVTFAVNVITAHALVFLAVLPFAPLYVQLPLAILIAVAASSPSWATRIIHQKGLAEKVKAKRQERSDAADQAADG